jgi:large subunit ribosomal protein L15
MKTGRRAAELCDNTIVDPGLMIQAGLVKKLYDGVKVLGKGELSKPLTVKAHRMSGSAKEKIEKAGGQVELIGTC